MIISRTPYRISFLGGGTDYPDWYLEHGGAVLGTTINKYCYLNCRFLPPFFEHRYNVVWSKIENSMTIDEIKHPAAREIIRFTGIDRGLGIHHDGDLPARSGTGSSSSFTVGLLNALYALQGKMVSKKQLLTDGIHIEQDILKENVGSQDQVFAAYGGLNHVQFNQSGQISVIPMTLNRERVQGLEDNLMLFYTGIRRTASDVVETFKNQLGNKKRQLRIMMDLAQEGVNVLSNGAPIRDFGDLLHEGWMLKRELGEKVSNPLVDEMYQSARDAGAIGGKLSGAGGGGFMLLCVPPEKRQAVKDQFKDLVHVPFKFESNGSQIIFHELEEDFEKIEKERIHQSVTPFQELNEMKKTGEES
jgi:D-glycero-alpha-D-manno-heptose-7-phosphate kinase